jgi:hypothetical protein
MSPTLRLAGRVCLGLGIDDPEAWLANVSQRTLAFWEGVRTRCGSICAVVRTWGNDRGK